MDKQKDLKLLIIFYLKDDYYPMYNIFEKLSSEEKSRIFDLISGLAKQEVQI